MSNPFIETATEALNENSSFTAAAAHSLARTALASLAQHRDDIVRAMAACWWDRNSGDTDLWDDLAPDEQANVIENIAAEDYADAVLAAITKES